MLAETLITLYISHRLHQVAQEQPGKAGAKEAYGKTATETSAAPRQEALHKLLEGITEVAFPLHWTLQAK